MRTRPKRAPLAEKPAEIQEPSVVQKVIEQRASEKVEGAMAYTFKELELQLLRLGITVNMLTVYPRRERSGWALNNSGVFELNLFNALKEQCIAAAKVVVTQRLIEVVIDAKEQDVQAILDQYLKVGEKPFYPEKS
jgi:hypothetical protein